MPEVDQALAAIEVEHEDDPDPEQNTISANDALSVAIDHLLALADGMADQMEVALRDLRTAATRVKAYAAMVGEDDTDGGGGQDDDHR